MDIINSYRDADIYLHHSRTAAGALPSLTFDAHIHDRYELYYFLSGTGTMIVENMPYRMEPGVFLLLRPGETHFIQPTVLPETDAGTEAPAYERMALIFRREIFDGALAALCDGFRMPSGAGTGNGAYAFRDEDGYVRMSLEMVFSAEPVQRRQTVICALAAILSRCLIGQRPIEAACGDSLVSDILTYVNAHLNDDWRMEDLAAQLSFDRSYLNRRFRAVMGTGICSYAIRKRLLAAQQNMYLQDSVTAGYATGGFGDYSTYFRQYRKFFGTSPSDDLNRYRETKK